MSGEPDIVLDSMTFIEAQKRAEELQKLAKETGRVIIVGSRDVGKSEQIRMLGEQVGAIVVDPSSEPELKGLEPQMHMKLVPTSSLPGPNRRQRRRKISTGQPYGMFLGDTRKEKHKRKLEKAVRRKNRRK